KSKTGVPGSSIHTSMRKTRTKSAKDSYQRKRRQKLGVPPFRPIHARAFSARLEGLRLSEGYSPNSECSGRYAPAGEAPAGTAGRLSYPFSTAWIGLKRDSKQTFWSLAGVRLTFPACRR